MATRVSVVIPTYRRPHFLLRAIESVRLQTTDDWELIVSDDEGVDSESARLVRAAWPTEGRIRIVGNSRSNGQAGNTNTGLLEASAPWIKLLHDDDWLHPDALRRLLIIAEGAYNATLISSDFIRVRTARPLAPKSRGWPTIQRVSSEDALVAMYFWERLGGPAPSCLMAARDMVQAGALWRETPDIKHMGDRFWRAALVKGGELVIYEKPLVYYQVGTHQTVSGTRDRQQVEKELRCFHEVVWPAVRERYPNWPPAEAARARRAVLALYDLKAGKRPSFEGVSAIIDLRNFAYVASYLAHYATRGRYSRIQRRALNLDQLILCDLLNDLTSAPIPDPIYAG